MGRDTSDEDLMMRYCKGDSAAFEILYHRHKGPLYRYVQRQCGHAGTAEDLFQEIWMKLIGARERYQVRAKFTTYLYHMAHNRMIDYFRSSRPVDSVDPEEDIASLAGRPQDQPERRTEQERRNHRLLELIGALPPQQREAFLLKEEAGHSLQEIAQITGVNPETAKSRLRYAINKLRQGLDE